MTTKKIHDYSQIPQKGGTKKLKDYQDLMCKDPQHLPAQHQVFSPGLYEHECPTCGHKTTFEVPLITNSVQSQHLYDDESPSYIRNTEDGI